jgi:hypothetical protein
LTSPAAPRTRPSTILFVLAVFLACLLLARPAAAETRFLHTGPYAENEFSITQPWDIFRTHSGAPYRSRFSGPRETGSGSFEWTGDTNQIIVRRVEDAFAFRVLTHGPGSNPQRLAGLADDGAFRVTLKLRATDGGSYELFLGSVTLRDFQVIETPFGPGLGTDWIMSPSSYRSRHDMSETEWAELDRLWQLGVEATQPNAPIHAYRFTSELVEIEWYPYSFWEHHPDDSFAEDTATQRYGAQALDAIARAEEVRLALYQQDDINEQRREEIRQWMTANFNPVGPYAQVNSRCGAMPPGWEPPDSVFDYAPWQESTGSLLQAVKRLDNYADCATRVWETFDYAAYDSLYPQVLEKVAEWQEAGGELTTDEWVPSDRYIIYYAHVAPENIDRAFEMLIRQVTQPNAVVRQDASDRLQDEARERRIAAEERRSTMEYRARMGRAAAILAQAPPVAAPSSTPSFDDIINTDLVGMQENARVAAETGDTSILYDSSGNIRTQEAPEVAIYDAQKRAIANRASSPDQGSNATAAGSSAREAERVSPERQASLDAPPLERNRFIFLATTKSKYGITVGPNHGCSIPWDWQVEAPAEGWGTISCEEVDRIDLYTVEVGGERCPYAGSARIGGPMTVGRIFRIENLTATEVERGYQYTQEELHIFRRAQQDAKGNLEARLVDRGPIVAPPSSIRMHYFRYLTEAQRFVRDDLGCDSYIVPEEDRPSSL